MTQAFVRAEKAGFGDAFVYRNAFHGKRMFISEAKKMIKASSGLLLNGVWRVN